MVCCGDLYGIKRGRLYEELKIYTHIETKSSCITHYIICGDSILCMQLNISLIDQKCNACIDGRRF